MTKKEYIKQNVYALEVAMEAVFRVNVQAFCLTAPVNGKDSVVRFYNAEDGSYIDFLVDAYLAMDGKEPWGQGHNVARWLKELDGSIKVSRSGMTLDELLARDGKITTPFKDSSTLYRALKAARKRLLSFYAWCF